MNKDFIWWPEYATFWQERKEREYACPFQNNRACTMFGFLLSSEIVVQSCMCHSLAISSFRSSSKTVGPKHQAISEIICRTLEGALHLRRPNGWLGLGAEGDTNRARRRRHQPELANYWTDTKAWSLGRDWILLFHVGEKNCDILTATKMQCR